MMRALRLRGTWSERTWTILNYLFLALIGFVCLYPLLFVVSASFSDPAEVVAGRVYLLPRHFSLKTYEFLLGFAYLWSSLLNTLFYVLVGTALNVALTMAAAYPLSRAGLRGRRPLTIFIIFTMFFGGGMIPTFLVVRQLGLIDTRWAMIIPSAVSAWNLIVARSYLATNIPDELVEAAELDGANDLQTFLRVVIPISGPIIAVITLFYAIGHWNDFFSALLYLRDQALYPIQVFLRLVVNGAQVTGGLTGTGVGSSTEERSLITFTLRYAMIVVATVPVMFIYPFLQRYFVKGMMIGSLKG
jgi:putative aldouronate transport system permease protein